MARERRKRFSWTHRIQRWAWLRHWFKRNPEPLILLLMTKGHLEVEKIHLSSRIVRSLKLAFVAGVFLLFVSSIIFIQFIITLPERSLLEKENRALKSELNRLQFHLDSLQTSVDRIHRFNQKLRALTEVDKEFARRRGPLGQGGSEQVANADDESFNFGDFSIEKSSLSLDDKAPQVLERRERFMIQKLYAWMGRLFKDTELESQTVEELFEVLKGRKLQLAATPSIMPVRGWVTSHFGHRIDPFTGRRALHKGMDIAARRGAPIVSPAEGIVSFAGPYGSFGNTVMIFHGYGISTLYAHAEDILVRVGQKVKRGDILATVGSSGRSTGSHVHYELIVHGVRVDPRKYILDRQL